MLDLCFMTVEKGRSWRSQYNNSEYTINPPGESKVLLAFKQAFSGLEISTQVPGLDCQMLMATETMDKTVHPSTKRGLFHFRTVSIHSRGDMAYVVVASSKISCEALVKVVAIRAR